MQSVIKTDGNSQPRRRKSARVSMAAQTALSLLAGVALVILVHVLVVPAIDLVAAML